uniref:uncharacterized protein LOC124073951 n=1 Tax=Scatophagus argus TaxID=75038 RepID=UPI001ED7FE31|nr:uncharacterized protein LOC124073951 [Scatophagus argus]XP_046272485.1 uncharacterized protein LOC124073951 [Scatophagus argus]XP_046272486.1 uncharacterized protein LOC124073951 [Scatophagus argus]
MATADLLMELIYSWIEQRERCANELRKLAKELESLRETITGTECVGSSVSVVGGVCLIGAGIATLCTGGAAAPALAVVGGMCAGAGITVSMAAKISEHFLSSSTMKKAQETQKKSKEIEEKVKKLFEQLKDEVKTMSPKGKEEDPDEVDQQVMTQILGAMGRRSGLGESDFRSLSNFVISSPQRNMMLNQNLLSSGPNVCMTATLLGIVGCFTFQCQGRKYKKLLAVGGKKLASKITETGLKTALKGGTMIVGGVVTLAFELPEAIDSWKKMIENNNVTEASQSLRDTADDQLAICQTLKRQLSDVRRKLEELADVKRCIENSKRSPEDKKKMIQFVIQWCEDEALVQWLKTNSEWKAFFKLIDMFYLLRGKLSEEIEKKKKTDCEDIDITFVAHGSIEESMIPASYLLPLPTVKDVMLYSPWNCFIYADVAYGIATGKIRPQHRRFKCSKHGGCRIPDLLHQPSNLPNHWNSMESAGGQLIPNIIVSPVGKPGDGAWNHFVYLEKKHGEAGRNRVVIPFILPAGITSWWEDERVPFFVVTLALSVVLSFSCFKATIHLAACLGKGSEGTNLDENHLKNQYAWTIDKTAMAASGEMLLNRDSDLYRALQLVFG